MTQGLNDTFTYHQRRMALRSIRQAASALKSAARRTEDDRLIRMVALLEPQLAELVTRAGELVAESAPAAK